MRAKIVLNVYIYIDITKGMCYIRMLYIHLYIGIIERYIGYNIILYRKSKQKTLFKSFGNRILISYMKNVDKVKVLNV